MMASMAVSVTSSGQASEILRAAGLWDSIVEPARPFLRTVTQRLAAQVDAFEPEIAEYARYALDNQGKQLRPALVALGAGLPEAPSDSLATVAVIIEMVHLATLVHDDIMDGATLRRSRPTLAAKWGPDIAVLVGDCLFAHALNLAAEFPTTDVSRAIARATHVVCTGEILQSLQRRKWSMGRAEYYRTLEMKTAELFALACSLGGRLSGLGQAEEDALRRYGLALGTAYQIYDDLLDLFGSEADAGKSLGTDLAKGKITLPVLIFLEKAAPADRRQMIGWLERWDGGYFVGVRSLLEQAQALPESRQVIDGFLSSARDELSILPDPNTRVRLEALTAFLAQQTARLGF
jgi:octaprenyl-diphosphate synthase